MEHSTDSGDCKPEGKARARRTSRRGESAIAEAVAGAGRLIDAHPEVLDWIREDRLALGRLRKSRLARDARLRRLPGSFGILIVDSTPVRADMALVTDTHLVWSSADRLCGLLGRAAADDLLAPALSAEARGWLDALERALVGLMLCVRQARARWLKKMVPRAGEKFLGAADPDAAIIMKGGRAPVLGYHPQIVTGVCGMVATVVVDQGCLSDAASLRAAVGMAVEATGVTPSAVSADNGYTSRANLKWIRDGLGALASFRGAKGRRLTPPGEWDDDAYRALRRVRARFEGVISTLKRAHLLGRAACVGEGRVRAELLCKVITYDLMLPYKREVRAHGRRRPDRTACAFRPEATGGA